MEKEKKLVHVRNIKRHLQYV